MFSKDKENNFVRELLGQFGFDEKHPDGVQVGGLVRTLISNTNSGKLEQNWELLQKGADLRITRFGFLSIILRVAVAYNRADIVQQAIDMGADFSSSYGRLTALDYAFKGANFLDDKKVPLEAIKVLLENGVQASSFIKSVTLYSDDIELYKALIQWQKTYDENELPYLQVGASNFSRKNVNAQKFFILQCEAQGYFQAKTKSAWGEYLLEYFASEGQVASAKFLIERLGTKSEPRFAKAYVIAIDKGSDEIIQSMGNSGVSVSGQYLEGGVSYTPLFKALVKNNVLAFKALLKGGADYNEKVSYLGDKDVSIEELAKRRYQTEIISAINRHKLNKKNKTADAGNPSMDALRTGVTASTSSSSSSSSSTSQAASVTTKKSQDVQRVLITINDSSLGLMPANGDSKIFPFSFSALEQSLTGDVSAVIEGNIPLSKMLAAIAKVAEAQEKAGQQK